MKTYTIDNRPTLLKAEDVVIFNVEGRDLKHHVLLDHLEYLDGSNNEVFVALGLECDTFAKKAYGYEPRWGCWPTSRDGDFPALTRLVNSLFDKIAEKKAIHGYVKFTESKPDGIEAGKVYPIDRHEGKEYWAHGRYFSEGDSIARGIAILCDKDGNPHHHSFKIGDRVRVKASVAQVAYGWGTVKHGDVGVVRSVESAAHMTVNFERQEGWGANPSEMELAPEVVPIPAPRPFKVGELVAGKSNTRGTEVGIITMDDRSSGNQSFKVNSVWMLTDSLIRLPNPVDLVLKGIDPKFHQNVRDLIAAFPKA
jgi:hypothetical protein